MSKPQPSPDISRRLRERREEVGWLPADLAERVGVQREQVYRWESGKANPVGPMRQIVCRALGVREGWLVTGQGAKLIDGAGSGDGTVGDA